jgi:DNA-binding NarL/FixJ family response regulator
MVKVLIANNSNRKQNHIESIIMDQGHEVVGHFRPGDSLSMLCDELNPDFIVLDVKMPPGVHHNIRILKNDYPNIKIFVSTSNFNTNNLQTALNEKTTDYVLKPFNSRKISIFQTIIELKSKLSKEHHFHNGG